ncbi:hypothetical protein KDH_32420 [Dictyobacter sp. S3.2.2.5]|uniref:Yip1 domain-containing protein n=1 Tax=Dictyobacter halimunensis TaxID=3026934 RepID=A0ABQ6FQ46_9CHLR|nr:hypothetical protein KDH_32420 [Dictyobacter sp. S3.2.2.5]
MSYNPDQGSYPGAFPPGSGYGLYGSGGVTETPSQPLPLRDAVSQLPTQYFRVLTKPGASTFAQENGKAAWNIIWMQILILAVISTIFSIINIFIQHPAKITPIRNGGVLNSILAVSQAIISLGPVSGTIIHLLWAVAGFFAGTGIYYLIARAFRGQGTWKQHVYSTLLISTPLRLFYGLVGLISIVNINMLLFLVMTIYQLILQVYMTMAVHRLSGGRATMAVLLLPIALFILACVATVIIVALLISSLHK